MRRIVGVGVLGFELLFGPTAVNDRVQMKGRVKHIQPLHGLIEQREKYKIYNKNYRNEMMK